MTSSGFTERAELSILSRYARTAGKRLSGRCINGENEKQSACFIVGSGIAAVTAWGIHEARKENTPIRLAKP